MESITNHIKQTSQSVSAPMSLRTRVLSTVTSISSKRTTNDKRSSMRLSPYSILTRTRSVALIGALCLVIIVGTSIAQPTPYRPTDTIALADTIIADVSATNSDEYMYNESESTLDDIQFYSELYYSDDEQVSSKIINTII